MDSLQFAELQNILDSNSTKDLTSTEQHQSLPQAVLDATTLVHGDTYPGEGPALPHHQQQPHFLVNNSQSPDHSDVSSYYSDDSNASTQQMPQFSQLTSPNADFPSTSSFQFPSFGHLKREDYAPKTEDFGLTPCQVQNNQQHHHSSVSSSMGMESTSFPFVTSPSQSLPSPSSTIYSASSPGTPGPSTPSGRGRRPHGCTGPYNSKTRRRHVEKGTQEYSDKRARNNVAVRKSRAKAKQKQRHTEGRVQGLIDQNDQLQKKVDLLSKELNVLKGLFLNIGASIPEDFLKMVGDS